MHLFKAKDQNCICKCVKEDDIPEHCDNEDRYTINHYYRCKRCGEVFFIGFCCRGGFLFKVEKFPNDYAKTIENINFEHTMEG